MDESSLLQHTHDAVIRMQTQFEEHLQREARILDVIESHDKILRGKDGHNGLCARVNSLERWIRSVKALWMLVVGSVIGALGTWFSQR